MKQHHGSAADFAAFKGMRPFDEFEVTSGTNAGNIYRYYGEYGWALISSKGSSVFTLPVPQSGTTAERDIAYPTPTGDEVWDNTTLGYRQWYNAASAQWEKDLTPVNGAMPVADSIPALKITQSGGYTYMATAASNYGRFASRALHEAAAEWAARRIDATGNIENAGTGYNSVATDLTALSYS